MPFSQVDIAPTILGLAGIPVGKTPSWSHIVTLKTINLPRQARDKHREDSKTERAFCADTELHGRPIDCSVACQHRSGGAARCEKRHLFFGSVFPMFVPSLSGQNDRLYI